MAEFDIELAVLACMASAPRVAASIAEELEVQDFLLEDHRVLFATMVDMLRDGRRVDELTLAAELREDGHDDVLGVAHGLYRVASQLPSVDNAASYAQLVREGSTRRMLSTGVDRALSAGGDVEEVVARMEAVVFQARSKIQHKAAATRFTGASILDPLRGFLDAPESHGGYPYPFPKMREKYGVYERGRMTYLGGYSGDGKTTVAMQWVEDLCEAGARVGVYELEMTGLGLARVLAAQGAGITPRQAKSIDPMSLEDLARLEQRALQIAKWDITFETGGTTPSQIRADQARERYDVILIDHVQKFPNADDFSTITNYSSQLHRITRDLDCSIICLSQLKTRQDGTRPEPDASMLRGTRGMEEDADDVLFIYRDRGAFGKRGAAAQLLVSKMRDGETDQSVPLTFIPERVRFFETSEIQGVSVAQQKAGV